MIETKSNNDRGQLQQCSGKLQHLLKCNENIILKCILFASLYQVKLAVAYKHIYYILYCHSWSWSFHSRFQGNYSHNALQAGKQIDESDKKRYENENKL